MKYFILIVAITLLSTTTSKAQINNTQTATVKVFGNCGMCETAIEKAATKNNISKADWNEETKMATITYDSKKTNMDAVLKSIALAGYDNQSFLAPDAAYNKLPNCCKYDRDKKQIAIQPKSETTNSMQSHANYQDNIINNNIIIEANQLKPVFDSYFSLKDALVKTDGNTALVKSKDLQTAITEVKMDKLSMEVHIVWMKVLNELKTDTDQINRAKDISKQRDYFMRLSKNMYELIKAAKLLETVYYQFCPMANNGKGANWLSMESGIKNPYYGSEMLTCGKVVETIKQ